MLRLAAAGVALGVPALRPANAGVTERVSVDPVSGVAIFGFDPVAYFVHGHAQAGRPEHEAAHGGAIWRFASDGNRAAFLRDPDVYMPAFGGYDGDAMLRGTPVAADSEVFAIVRDRLVLFRFAQGRAAFLERGEGALDAAEANWQTLLPQLLP